MCQAAERKVKAKVSVSFPSSAGGHGCPNDGQGYVPDVDLVTVSDTAPSGKGEAHE